MGHDHGSGSGAHPAPASSLRWCGRLRLGAAVLISLGIGKLSVAEDWVRLDFRNRIPGMLDAPVYDYDGQPLEGPQAYTQVLAQLYYSPEGPYALAPVSNPMAFGAGTNAGYWEPFDPAVSAEVTLPGATVGREIFYEIRVLEWLPIAPFGEYVTEGRSPTYRVVVTNTAMTLAGLESFRLEPEPLRIRREGNQVVIEWNSRGARYYTLYAASSLVPSAPWYPVFWSSNYAPAGTVFSVTNTVTDTAQFYRLWRSR